MNEALQIKIHYLKVRSFSNIGAEKAKEILTNHIPALLGLAINITLKPHNTHQEVYQVIKDSLNTEAELNFAIVPTSSTDQEGFIRKAASEVFADQDLIPVFGIPVNVEQYPAVSTSNLNLLNGSAIPDLITSHPAALIQVEDYINRMNWEGVEQLASNSTAEGLQTVASNPDKKYIGFGRKETAEESGLEVGEMASKSITRMSLVANQNTPSKILSALENIANIENKTELTNVIISNLRFQNNKSGQLYNLLTSLERFGDIRYAHLQNNPQSDYITCTIRSADTRFLVKNLAEISKYLDFNVNYIPVLGDDIETTGDVYNEAIKDSSKIIYKIQSEKEIGDHTEITLAIPDIPGSLLELAYRVRQENVNLEYLTTQIAGNEKEGVAIIKFKNTNNESQRITQRLINENVTEFEEKNIRNILDKRCFEDLNEDDYVKFFQVNLTRNDYEELKRVALYNQSQDLLIPPNLSLRIQRKYSIYAIESMIKTIRELASEKQIKIDFIY